MNEEEYMSEHKIAQDNIDIDVDVSSNVADDKALNTSSDDTLENVSASKTIQDSAKDIEAESVKVKDG